MQYLRNPQFTYILKRTKSTKFITGLSLVSISFEKINLSTTLKAL